MGQRGEAQRTPLRRVSPRGRTGGRPYLDEARMQAGRLHLKGAAEDGEEVVGLERGAEGAGP